MAKKSVVYLGAGLALVMGLWVFQPKLNRPQPAAPSSPAIQYQTRAYAAAAQRTAIANHVSLKNQNLPVPSIKSAILENRSIGRRSDTANAAVSNQASIRQLSDNFIANQQHDVAWLRLPPSISSGQEASDLASHSYVINNAVSRDTGREFTTSSGLSEDEKQASELTAQLSKQSLDHFYSILFDSRTDLGSVMRAGGYSSAQDTSGSTTGTSGADGNPFADAISNLKRDPLPGSSTASTSSAPVSTSGQPASQNSSTTSNGTADPAPRNPSQPVTPPSQTTRPRDPTPQINIPGTTKSFTIIGDIREVGVGGIYPALRLQANQFEIPQIGLVNLKLWVIADPAYGMLTTLVDDVNGDGTADITMTSEREFSVMVWLGLPNGDFVYAGGSPTPNGGRSLAVADFNSDNKPDLAILQGADPRSIDILYGDGNGRFIYADTTQLMGECDMLVATDLDDRGRLDLFGTNLSTFRSWVLLAGDTPMTFLKSAFAFTNLPTAQVLQDINLDSRLEQLFLFQYRMKLSVVLNPPKNLVVRHIATTNLRYPMILVLGDLQGEGFTDLGIARLKH